MEQKETFCVLVSPLDWGLGHATRCIPIIKELDIQGIRVLIAASGPSRMLLKQEFPHLEFLGIPGYQIRYGPGILLKWALILRIPSILKQIKREHAWLAACYEQYKIDAVISDNRYGLYHGKLFCVYITHQLFIQSGWGINKVSGWRLSVGGLIDRKILKWNYKFISKFSECWVPDQDGYISFAGKLSHPPFPPPVPLKYIGILSRFRPTEERVKKNSLLILISGPEPHRTLWENILFSQLEASTGKAIVVRGLPGGYEPVPFLREGVEIFNHLPSDKLNELLITSEFIIARSGYSTIMDLLQLKRNAILIPTPGQTEQEYLSRWLHEKKWMYTISQKNFCLNKALNEFIKAEWILPELKYSLLREQIGGFLRMLANKQDSGLEKK